MAAHNWLLSWFARLALHNYAVTDAWHNIIHVIIVSPIVWATVLPARLVICLAAHPYP